MEYIYSDSDPGTLLHIIVRKTDIISGRINVVDPKHFIQCALLNLTQGTIFKPHKHKWRYHSANIIAQESWVVIQGKIQCIFYDLNGEKLDEPILEPGDASFTLEGGHNYLILEGPALVYEYKTGPYEGQAVDKEFLE
jgi:cupin fold WbuC family metalloprotein